MYSKILLAIAVPAHAPLSEHAQAAQEAATTLAKGADAAIHLLTVYDYSAARQAMAVGVPDGGGTVAVGASSRDAGDKQEIDDAIERRLDEIARAIHAQGIDVVADKIVGEPDAEIVRMAEQIGADLIVIGSHQRRNILDIGLGSNARAVASHAPCPVVMVNPN